MSPKPRLSTSQICSRIAVVLLFPLYVRVASLHEHIVVFLATSVLCFLLVRFGNRTLDASALRSLVLLLGNAFVFNLMADKLSTDPWAQLSITLSLAWGVPGLIGVLKHEVRRGPYLWAWSGAELQQVRRFRKVTNMEDCKLVVKPRVWEDEKPAVHMAEVNGPETFEVRKVKGRPSTRRRG
ncbi:hypothetical protein CC86DRAFT_377591 [Ophiobolus disseminans]|uniref:Uncharacterized protein n=1 Tax=Ophiobolus disseminans TaxID=1469910 RepID=A0A6A7AGM1_9PLEO|nr:hypothetical protein CC86DRAFT_377591 [Ophiobolus disseminans]